MKKNLLFLLFSCIAVCQSWCQNLRLVPDMSAQSGTYDDQVDVTCIFPEGCAGGKYWINGGELRAIPYTEPVRIDYSCNLSVAGVDAQGRIITDVVTRAYTINRVTPPTLQPTPAEGIRSQSFYVTALQWTHVTQSYLDLSAFREGGSRHGEKVVWLTDESGNTLSSGDYNSIWADGLNRYKAYIYKDYNINTPGHYTLHVAKGVFVLDGKRHDQEVQLKYEVSDGGGAPTFSPASGEYKGSVTVTISYPTDGSAFYQFYKLGNGKAKSYNGPLTLTESTTVSAYGMDEDFTSTTATSTASYTILPEDPKPEVLDVPVINRQGNTLTITGPQGAILKYWVNHSMNTAQCYSVPLNIEHNMHIACVAYREGGISPTVEMDITDLPSERGNLGELILLTPATVETAHVRALSPNGRYAVGFVGSDTSSKGFIWDLESDDLQYQSILFANQLWSVSNEGVAYGWRTRTDDIDESTKEDDLLWGICQDGTWTEKPQNMSVNGISGEGLLYGSIDGVPATWNTKTQEIVRYATGNATQGTITAISGDGNVLGGSLITSQGQKAVLWTSASELKVQSVGSSISALSANGQWAIIDQTHRLNVKTGEAEYLVSTSDRYSSGGRPEVLKSITNEGLILGTYDGSLLGSEKGNALIRTLDGRWRNMADWLVEQGIGEMESYFLSSVADVTGDGNTLLFSATRRGVSNNDGFTRGLLLRINTPVRHLAPGGLRAEQMNGLEVVKLTWKAPLTEQDQVKQYILSRNGQELARLEGNATEYYDHDVKVDDTYRYHMNALYQDGIESSATRTAAITVSLPKHLPARNIKHRRIGYNDLNLYWDAPIVSLPKLQYFNEESENMPFGTGSYDAEFGIRIDAKDLTAYEGQQIRTFQFLPSGPQRSYTLNLYQGDGKGSYEPTPIYSQSIDPSTLAYGTVNTVELTQAQNLPEGRDLFVGLLIETAGNSNMLGVSYEGFRSGYTDLCRIVGIFPEMIPMSTNSSTTTQVVLPLGLGISSAADYDAAIVSNYRITDNGKEVTLTDRPQWRLSQMSEGEHQLAVTAIYRDGIAAEPTHLDLTIQNNQEALVGVEVTATPQSDGTARLSWSAPRDWDRTRIHWGNDTPQRGWDIARGLNAFMALSAYPVTMTAPYAGEYEITELYFCPTDEAQFELMLTDEETNALAYAKVENPVIGEINYLKLDKPVVVDPSITYTIVANIWDVRDGGTPLGYDTSNKWQNGMSNVINYGEGNITLAEFLEAGENPNWFMGMVLQQREARELPVNGYHVNVDGKRVTNRPLLSKEYTTAVLAEGEHTASVEVVYPEKSVTGQETRFVLDPDGIISVGITQKGYTPVFDIQGRRRQHIENGINIVNNKKIFENR